MIEKKIIRYSGLKMHTTMPDCKFSTRLKEHQKVVVNKHSHKSALAEH